jgi:biopolymer transport protein ExbD
MAGIDVGGGHGGKRSINHEIPLIPFIDFLLCLVAFLLVTAVWTQMARINADAQVPGPPDPDKELKEQEKPKILHVHVKNDDRFKLVWKEGNTVINEIDVTSKKNVVGDEEYSYPDLAKKVSEEWTTNGSHRNATDFKRDQAVLHTENTTPFKDVVAVIDSIYTPQRELKVGAEVKKVPAFNVTFSVN